MRNLTPLRVYTGPSPRNQPHYAAIYERSPHGIFFGGTVTAFAFRLNGSAARLAKARAIAGELTNLGLIRPD